MLQEVLENLTKKITLTLELESLNEDFVNELKNLLKTHHGDKQLCVKVTDSKDKIQVNMYSQSVKIKLTKHLLKALESHKLPFKLN